MLDVKKALAHVSYSLDTCPIYASLSRSLSPRWEEHPPREALAENKVCYNEPVDGLCPVKNDLERSVPGRGSGGIY